MKTLMALFLSELEDLYEAENCLSQSLPRLAKAATSNELCEAFKSLLAETEVHVTKLEKVFQLFGRSARGKRCHAMASLFQAAGEIVSDHKFAPTLDAALICAMQKVEHYAIASYGGLREWAGQLGNQPAVELLQTVLNEEQAADQMLTEVARRHCNQSAQNGDPDAGATYADPKGVYCATNPGLVRMKVLARAGRSPVAESHAVQVRDLIPSRFHVKPTKLTYA